MLILFRLVYVHTWNRTAQTGLLIQTSELFKLCGLFVATVLQTKELYFPNIKVIIKYCNDRRCPATQAEKATTLLYTVQETVTAQHMAQNGIVLHRTAQN